ncbi:MAG TPA: NUDIX hydrolase [Catenuloplanes sp.]|jgi:ADP-ribose pyrophosphatase YjhB (NUDIX family)
MDIVETPPPASRQKQRVAAYAVCISDDGILLTHLIGANRWTLPGGGLDHGEDPYDAVIREVEEETGLAVEVDRLLGVSSVRWRTPGRDGVDVEHHGLRIIYGAHVTGGHLRAEANGSTDEAAWIALDRVEALSRVELVDVALELDRTRPPLGRTGLC